MTRPLILLFAAMLFVACDEEKPSGDGPSSGNASSGGSSGVSGFADDPCGLLSADDVRAVVPGMPADAEHYTGTKRMKVCQYSWPSDRKASREVMGKTIEYAVENVVCLKWIRKVKSDDPVAWFRNAYRQMTPEEKEQAKAAFERAMAEAAGKGEVTRDGQKIGTKTTGSMVDSLRFESVEGVGTAAAWGGTKDSIGLKVLDGDWEFEIQVNVSDDEAANRSAAITLAKKVLANAD